MCEYEQIKQREKKKTHENLSWFTQTRLLVLIQVWDYPLGSWVIT